ncbi:DNA methylase [Roseibium sp. TrichSKD4]|uniref:DNA-methyltransferase n=1 Tax=Roseibium sp. TrichSKD4 TaxID=744980 RepID=UPI0001E56B09|nr:site-specific DNA-methyltransferase [Roseibium sp. TrichSKD4]EFO32599.1 DNA methylase [Roseibium sp. TrichSKD4]
MSNVLQFVEGKVALHVGDVLEMLATLPDESVDCVVTSPPYWGLRDYGVEGQIGLEPTLAEHIALMVAVFEEVRRVLKPTGTLWLNYGDCYASSPNGRSAADTKAEGNDNRTFRDKPFSTVQGVLKPKDLCMIPNRLAIALQEAGWWVRSEIIWAKPNPMPESIRDRPATAHEKIFLLSKSAKYFYDANAVRQGQHKVSKHTVAGWASGPGAHDTIKHNRGSRSKDTNSSASPPNSRPHSLSEFEARHNADYPGRNLRNWEPEAAQPDVWKIATSPFPGAHFATFPLALAQRCVKAGCPKGGVVLDPFGGAGTTAIAALAHGCQAQLIEINPEYARIAGERIEQCFMGPDERARRNAKTDLSAGPLFSDQVIGA